MTELHYLSATEALGLFATRELSPVELMRAVIARAKAVEPAINAFTEMFFDEALAAARAAEARYATRDARPLEGLPIAIKDETAVAGQRTTEGSLIYGDAPAQPESAPVVERILGAGGIVHARTTVPEFACAIFTHSRLWGVTRNPWSVAHSPGGSSGGAAAALAAGTTTLANGSDIGGSIRVPASFCGIVGLKPAYGRVPGSPPFNLDHYCHEGPLARTVADCALLQNAISGSHPADIATVRPRATIPARLDSIEGWRIAYSPDLGGFPVDDAMASNARAAAEALGEAGAIVEEVELDWDWRELVAAARTHFAVMFGASIARAVERHRDLMTRYAIHFAEHVAVADRDYLKALEVEARAYAALAPMLERHRVLVCPTCSVPGLRAGEDYVDKPMLVNGVPRGDFLDLSMTLPFNMCGRCPAISVPSGFTAGGIPTGIQIVGPTYDEESVFRVAAALERVRPWFDAPERRPRLAA